MYTQPSLPARPSWRWWILLLVLLPGLIVPASAAGQAAEGLSEMAPQTATAPAAEALAPAAEALAPAAGALEPPTEALEPAAEAFDTAAGALDPATEAYLAGNPAAVGYCAVRLSDGAVLAAGGADRPMLPASVQKLCTSAVALARLGSDFQFTTTLALCGQDLAIVGEGDPTLGDPVLAQADGGSIYDVLDSWAAALKERGLGEVGDIVLEDGIFQERRHPDWPASQHTRWYCAPAGGLNFNDNCLDISLGIVEGRPVAQVQPASALIRVDNRLRVGRKQLWHATITGEGATVRLTGTVSQSMSEPLSVAVDDPGLLLGRVLADRLARAGLTVNGRLVRRPVLTPERALGPEWVVVARHATPLGRALARMNKNSLNLAAECVFLRAGSEPGVPTTFESAARTAQQVLQEQYGLPAEQVVVADGSGLSRRNRLSAQAAVLLLRQLARGPHAKMLTPTLAVAGVDGSLVKRLGHSSGRFIGKTGSLANVSTLAGYIVDPDGRPVVAAAIFCNDCPGGVERARQIQDALIARWIVEYGQGE